MVTSYFALLAYGYFFLSTYDMFQIRKTNIYKTSGTTCPSLTSECQISLTVEQCDNNNTGDFGALADSKCAFHCEVPTQYYDSVISECVRTMKEGEHSSFDVNFSTTDTNKPGLVKIAIQLHSFTEGKDFHDLSAEERIHLAENWKKFGNSLFSKSDFCMGGYWYSKALFLLASCHEDDVEKNLKDKYNDLFCCCRINLAAVQLRRKSYNHVITNCSEALNIHPHLVKALFRRAQAHIALNSKPSAIKDLKAALKVEPNSGAVRKLLGDITSRNECMSDSLPT